MARLAIRQVKYEGDLYSFVSPELSDGVNIIEGPNGSGKSTFAQLIYYCLGGASEMFNPDKNDKHKEILSDKNNYVEIHVQIDAEHFVVTRYIKDSDISIRYSSGNVEVYPVFRGKSSPRIFSDWFLERLSIDPIELSIGTVKWKLNLKDIFRLIYHDQAPNPTDIYKAPDTDGFVVDSKVMRKAIFEVLLGKSFQAYYKLLGQLRDAEAEKSKSRGALDLYNKLLDEVQVGHQNINSGHLSQLLLEKQQQLERLENFQATLNDVPVSNGNNLSRIEIYRSEMLGLELERSEAQQKESSLLSEVIKYKRVRADLILEVAQIKKMIHVHEKLSLFSADTCPYCLRDIQRPKGKCVCGQDIDEAQYERFFYSSAEYVDILKSKKKSVDTIELAIDAVQNDLSQIGDAIASLNQRWNDYKGKVEDLITQGGRPVDVVRLKEVGEKISQAKSEIFAIQQQLSLESKMQELTNRQNAVDIDYQTKSKLVDKLFADANFEMDVRIQEFNALYNGLMKSAVTDCRLAYLNSDYRPVINDGEHREASAAVPKRLMYFLTLLWLSLKHNEVKFPRFLLIDTPETSGIDMGNLIKALERISEILSNQAAVASSQIILTTGIGKYPEAYANDVKLTLSEDRKLLLRKDGIK